MSDRDVFYEVEETLLDEMGKEKHLFSFRNLVRALALSSIAIKF